MATVTRRHPSAGGLPPSATERMGWRCGRRLARLFPEVELVTLPLPPDLVAAMTPAERRAMRTGGHDWWLGFWDGWDSGRDAWRPELHPRG